MIKSELLNRIAAQNPHLYQRDIEHLVNAMLGMRRSGQVYDYHTRNKHQVEIGLPWPLSRYGQVVIKYNLSIRHVSAPVTQAVPVDAPI